MSSSSQRACEAGGRLIAPGVSPGIRVPILPKPAERTTADSSVRARPTHVQKVFCRPLGAQGFFYAVHPGLAPEATLCRRLRRLVVALVLTAFFGQMPMDHAQAPVSSSSARANSTQNPTPSRYLDQTNGTSADEAVVYAQ